MNIRLDRPVDEEESSDEDNSDDSNDTEEGSGYERDERDGNSDGSGDND